MNLSGMDMRGFPLTRISAAAGCLMVALVLLAPQGGSSSALREEEPETCAWHDHYRVNYRIRHHHCFRSLEEHYREDPWRKQHFHDREADEAGKKETIRLQFVPVPGTPVDEDRTVRWTL